MTPAELEARLRQVAADSRAAVPEHVKARYRAHVVSAEKWRERGNQLEADGRLRCAAALRTEWAPQ